MVVGACRNMFCRFYLISDRDELESSPFFLSCCAVVLLASACSCWSAGFGAEASGSLMLEAYTLQVSCMQYHLPEMFQTIMGTMITHTKRSVFHLTTSCLPSHSASRSGWFLCSCLAPSAQPFYFRAPFHLVLACSQLCTFWVWSSNEVISCCRSCSPRTCTWVPGGVWDLIASFGKCCIQAWLKKSLESGCLCLAIQFCFNSIFQNENRSALEVPENLRQEQGLQQCSIPCLYAKAASQQNRVWGDGNTANIPALTAGAVDPCMLCLVVSISSPGGIFCCKWRRDELAQSDSSRDRSRWGCTSRRLGALQSCPDSALSHA